MGRFDMFGIGIRGFGGMTREVIMPATLLLAVLCVWTPVTSSQVGGAGTSESPPVPLDMLVILDRSGSMAAVNWTGAISGLNSFFYDPDSSGTVVGLNSFGVDGAPDQCVPSLYDPPQVALGELPGHATTLLNALFGQIPGGGTPTHPALQGTLTFAVAHQSGNPGHVVIVVLVTDGDPSECDTSIAAIAGLASSAFNSNGIRTYVVGLPGANQSSLDQIAAQGATFPAYILADASLLGEAMSLIRVDAIGSLIFQDSFESGDTSAWSIVVP